MDLDTIQLPLPPTRNRRQHLTLSPKAGAPRFLDSKNATSLQERLDCRLAQRLQQEEHDANYEVQSLGAQRGRSSGRYSQGTQDDPIDLELDLKVGFGNDVHECFVCSDGFSGTELPSLTDCSHPPHTCSGCFADWGEAKCPESNCKVMLTYYEIQQIATSEIFEKYDTFIAPNFRWCRRCDFGQIHTSGEGENIFTCALCGHKVCVIHEDTWHEGETCAEYEHRSSPHRAQDKIAQEAAINRLSKKCPGRNCIYNIEKNNGCDHMTCMLNEHAEMT
ncbi:hypothetical protein CC86DRAFT_434951 [Ophiobolus disseminans]|uniref:RBR-type E3 ubiquitin transferase n=1 Tax=Ophiobolus disseminans TaxID=1469910 RepID=A0A6A6ZD74_9PLEO|nr:hypothetical protein CC86DRAFT_434951 [Ophiobolus disseminans]